jgi:putative ABC transport system ATP-binding protein
LTLINTSSAEFLICLMVPQAGSSHSVALEKVAGMAEVIFETRGLTKVYDTGDVRVHALRGVDVKFYASEMTVLLGASGSGKSTLLNILGGLDRGTDGKVLFRGEDIMHSDEHALTDFRRRHVGFVFQIYNLMPSLTARENVALVTHIACDPMTPEAALELVGLGERMDHFPAELSGGEQQRVAIARAIAKRPGVLLCDEPTGALDSKTGIKVLEALVAVNQEMGTTTAIITHNAEIRRIAHRVLYLQDGQIVRTEENATRVSPAEITW